MILTETSMKNELIEAGKIVNTHGINGDVRIQAWTDTPEFLEAFEHLYIDGTPVRVLRAKKHKGCVIATLDGVEDIDSAIRLKNKVVSVKRESLTPGEGRFFIADITGLRAIDADTGAELGIITGVLSLPANNVYVIRSVCSTALRDAAIETEGLSHVYREILVPAVPEFVIETNIKEGYIRLRLIEGM